MVDVAVTLPESRPEDDEDVVWGLSTAAALWARGEHGDAIVWLRRAADAAAGAGQDARAHELSTAATRAEQTLERIRRQTIPPPAETGIEERLSLGIEVDIGSTPPPSRTPTVSPLVPAPAATTPTAAASAAQVPDAASSPKPPSPRAQIPSYPPHILARAVQAALDATPRPPSVRPASMTPPPPEVAAPPAPSARKSGGLRVPILDPWSDEPSQPHPRVDPPRAVQVEGDELVVQMRRNLPRPVEEDDGVITSAAPLDQQLRRVTRPAPPVRRWTATGEQPPGHIAEASTAVAPKVPGASKRPPPVPPGHAAGPHAPAPPVPSPPATSPVASPLPPAPSHAAAPAPPHAVVPAPPHAVVPAPPPTAPAPVSPPHEGTHKPPMAASSVEPSDPNDVATQPTVPSPIARPRAVTVPPPGMASSVRLPAAPTRVPTLASLAAATTTSTPPAPLPAAATFRSGSASVRPPPGPASVRPPATMAPPPAPAAAVVPPPAPATVPRPPARPASPPASPLPPRPPRPKGT